MENLFNHTLLDVRIFVAQMLRNKIRRKDYEKLFDRMVNSIVKGIDLPPAKHQQENFFDVINNTLQSMKFPTIANLDLPIIKDNENPIKRAYEKYKGKTILQDRDKRTPIQGTIVGYSEEFSCLIAATKELTSGVKLGEKDIVFMDSFADKEEYRFFYISIQEVEKQLKNNY